MTQVMVYTQPLLMYSLSLISANEHIKVIWAVLASLQVLDIFPAFNHFMCCIIITFFFFVPFINPQYAIQFQSLTLPLEQTYNTVIAMFLVLMVFLNVYSNPHPEYKQTLSK